MALTLERTEVLVLVLNIEKIQILKRALTLEIIEILMLAPTLVMTEILVLAMTQERDLDTDIGARNDRNPDTGIEPGDMVMVMETLFISSTYKNTFFNCSRAIHRGAGAGTDSSDDRVPGTAHKEEKDPDIGVDPRDDRDPCAGTGTSVLKPTVDLLYTMN